jgi:diguanylate cyclase (GGDEF)-like protein
MFRNGLHSFRRGSLRALRIPALLWLPLAGVLGAGLGGWWGVQQARRDAYAHAEAHLAVAAVQTRALLDRYELLPDIAALFPCVAEALQAPDDPRRIAAANHRLAQINKRVLADVTYALDREGHVVAASNWDSPGSFVGENYAQRPYFRDALAGGTGRFVGIGLSTGKLGYYLARPIRVGPRNIGVIAAKVSLTELERQLAELARALPGHGALGIRATVLLADADGVVFISTDPRWRYRTLAPLPVATRAALAVSGAYADEPLTLLPSVHRAAPRLSLLQSDEMVSRDQTLPTAHWRLRVLVPVVDSAETIWAHALLGALLGLLAAALVLLVLLREIYQRRVLAAAIRDPLTGLYSRMYMNESLPRLIARHDRDPAAAFGVAILDLDHFKRINDRFGHLAGDRLLAELGDLVRGQCEATDLAVRLGGEELAIFHVQPVPGATLRLAERLRLLVQHHGVRWEDREIVVTLSGGVAEHRPGETLVQVLRRADRALYRAKRAGRNRIIDADPPTDGSLPPGLSAQIAEPSGAD